MSPAPDPALIAFRPLAEADLPLLLRWLTAPHVRQWWDPDVDWTPELVAEKYGGYARGEKPTRAFLILQGQQPIGYIQTYRIHDWPDYAAALGLAEVAAGLDLFIGEAGYLHSGLGPQILTRFLREVVFADPEVVSCVVDPEPANRVAIRAYEKAGFRYLKTVQVPGEPQPGYLMRVERATVAGP